MKIKRLAILSLVILTAALALPAAAQDANTDEPQANTERRGRARAFIFVEGSLPYVSGSNTISTKLPVPLLLTPFHVGVVTEAIIEEQYAPTISAALVNVSSINIQPGNGVNDYFLIRGFDSLSSVLVMTDGAAEPEATFYETYNVESVEVLKGPGGFLYGSNPLAGTVNLVRKQPLPNTLGGARATLGSFDRREFAGDFNYGRPDGNLFARVNAMFRDTKGYRDRIAGRTFAINPAITWKFGDSGALTLNAEYVTADNVPDSGVPVVFGNQPSRRPNPGEIIVFGFIDRDSVVPGERRTRNYQSALDDSLQDVYRFQADYQGHLSDSFTVRNKFYYRGLDWNSVGTLFNGIARDFDESGMRTGMLSVSRSLIALDNRQNWVGNQIEALYRGNTGAIGHNLVAGFEFARRADAFTLDVGFLPNVPLDNPGAPTPGPAQIIPGIGQAGDSRALIAAPYIVDQIALHSRLQVLAGVRVDTIDFQDTFSGVARTDTKASPTLGATFLIDPNTSLYGNYARSFAPPAPRVQNGRVEPEESKQLEFGLKHEFLDRRARATVAYYRMQRTNIGIPSFNGITQQVGSQRSRGMEAEFIAEGRGGLRFSGSYAYNVALLTEFSDRVIVGVDENLSPFFTVIDLSGNTPTFAPKHIFNAWVSQDIARSLVVGGGARYVSGQFIAEDNDFELPGGITLDAMVGYTFGDLALALNVKNLANRAYNQRGFGDFSVTPADPITVYFSVTFRR